MKKRIHQGNSGTVLIFILGISATLGAALVIAQSYMLNSSKRFQNAFEQTEAYYLAISGHQLAHRILEKDLSDNRIDSMRDNWYNFHAESRSYPLSEGTITLKLQDATSKPNLNQIYVALDVRDPFFYTALTHYLRNKKIQTTILPEIRDWVDNDNTPFNSGAEKNIYLSKNPSYIPENKKMVSLSDIKLLNSYLPKDFIKIKESVFALPEVKKSNINTVDKLWLQNIYPQIPIGTLNQFLEERKKDPYERINDALVDLDVLNTQTGVEFGVITYFFKLTSQAEIYGKKEQFNVLYERKNGRVMVRRFQWL